MGGGDSHGAEIGERWEERRAAMKRDEHAESPLRGERTMGDARHKQVAPCGAMGEACFAPTEMMTKEVELVGDGGGDSHGAEIEESRGR